MILCAIAAFGSSVDRFYTNVFRDSAINDGGEIVVMSEVLALAEVAVDAVVLFGLVVTAVEVVLTELSILLRVVFFFAILLAAFSCDFVDGKAKTIASVKTIITTAIGIIKSAALVTLVRFVERLNANYSPIRIPAKSLD